MPSNHNALHEAFFFVGSAFFVGFSGRLTSLQTILFSCVFLLKKSHVRALGFLQDGCKCMMHMSLHSVQAREKCRMIPPGMMNATSTSL